MRRERKRSLAAAVWVPLRAVQALESEGEYGHPGYRKEFFGAGSLAASQRHRDAVSELDWSSIGISYSHRSVCDDGEYVPCDSFTNGTGEVLGISLVLDQHLNHEDQNEWHLHQDLVVALQLRREGDQWTAPNSDYEVVAKLTRGPSGKPVLLQVRADYLTDYLCARGMALYVTSYRSREAVFETTPDISWTDGRATESEDGLQWEGRVEPIHEGGERYGAVWQVLHASRTDVDPDEDVPVVLAPADGSIEHKQWATTNAGRCLYRVSGEYWRTEWVEAATQSPKVRGDKSTPATHFIVDGKGTRAPADSLKDEIRWLWFKPDVVMALSDRRGGGLGWYTRQTGAVRCSPDYSVHFGLNNAGLVTVFAKDVVSLPEWQQRVWASWNVVPDGGVCTELFDAQMKVTPAATQPPEPYLLRAVVELNRTTGARYGFRLFRPHDEFTNIASRCHRFRAVDQPGLLALAKDVCRITADLIDKKAIHDVASPPDRKIGTLKSLEFLVASRIGERAAADLMSPLFGLWELRLADSHPPTGGLDESYLKLRIDGDNPWVLRGLQLLDAAVATLWSVRDVLRAIP